MTNISDLCAVCGRYVAPSDVYWALSKRLDRTYHILATDTEPILVDPFDGLRKVKLHRQCAQEWE